MVLELVVNLENHKRRIWSICWSPDGNYLASVGADKYIMIWVKKNNEKIRKTNNSNKIMKKALNIFGEKTQIKSNIEFDIYDIIETCHEKSLRHIEFSKDGSFFVVASFDSKCSIYKKNNNDKWVYYKMLEGHEKEVKCASIHPSNKYIVTCGRDKSIWVHAKGEVGKTDMNSENHASYNNESNNDNNENNDDNIKNNDDNIKNNPDNIKNNHDNIKNDDDNNYDNIKNDNSDKNNTSDFILQDNQTLSSLDKNNNLQHSSSLDFHFDAYLTAHTEDIKFVSWCPLSENTFISLSYDNSLKLWTKIMNEWNCIQTLNEHTSVVWCVTFNFDGSQFATCSDDKTIRIWKSDKKLKYNLNKYPFLYEKAIKDIKDSSYSKETSKNMDEEKINDKNTTCENKNVAQSNDTINNNNNNSNSNSNNHIDGGVQFNQTCEGKEPEEGTNQMTEAKSRSKENINNTDINKNNNQEVVKSKVKSENKIFKKTTNFFSKFKEIKSKKENEQKYISSNIKIVNYSEQKDDLSALSKVYIQHNFVPLYFNNGLFKYVYNFSQVEDNTNINNNLKKKEQHNKSNNNIKDNVTKNIDNDIINNIQTDEIINNDLIDKISNHTNIENDNKQKKEYVEDFQETSIHISEDTNSTIKQNINNKDQNINDNNFDDWKVNNVIQGYHKRSVSYIDWNAYEDLIAASSFDNSLKIFKKINEEWELISNIDNAHMSDVNCVVWCPQKYQDYFLLATAGDDCVINIWKYTKG
ncbi:cytosolic iron-sulfur protein assembly protein 1, putative [Plasmodium gaboni]|uniref:Probable cytosolic iron-sulfur protein assembly protein CIAO1 homolog n=1 Tax=Plasmodium gaboni TaxID=647221 RepID=A0ABY1UPW5_9APIC|nr:cytosolic iron-sulfur protein assembly protein 1, putative [Plasmodium gaboni]